MEQMNSQQKTPKDDSGCLRLTILIGVLILVCLISVIFVGTCNSNRSREYLSGDTDTTVIENFDTISENLPAEPQEDYSLKTWDYSTDVDEMNDSKSRFASLTSDNIVYFDFPYNGGSSLYLTVRYMKKYGTDVYIKISSGQFVCNEYEGTNYVRVRFDQGSAMKFTTNEPSDGSSDMLFLSNAKKFIRLAKKAKTIKIEAPFYQEGNNVFTFTVDKPLEW